MSRTPLKCALSLVAALVAAQASAAPAPAAGATEDCPRWDVAGNTLLKELPRSLPKDAAKAARKLAQAYVDEGYLTVRVMPLPERCTIQVYEMAADPRGEYKKHIPKGEVLNEDTLDIATNLMSREAFDRQERVAVGLGQPNVEKNQMDIKAQGFEDDRLAATSGGFVITTLGPRYSGATVAAANVRHSYEGVRMEANIAKAMPNVSTDSVGGDYQGIGAKVSTTVAGVGVVGAEIQHSSYQVGGQSAELDIKGKTTRVTAFADIPLTGAATLETKLSHAKQDQEMGAFGFKDQQTSTTAYLGLRYALSEPDRYAFTASTGVVQGITGSREYSDYQLSGAFDEKFTAVRGDMSFGAPLWKDSYLKLAAGGQVGAKGTPGAETFFLGGADRGSAYHSGSVSGPTGFYASANLQLTDIALQGGKTHVRPYVGLNGGLVKPNVGEGVRLASAEVGIAIDTPWFVGQLGYATKIADTTGEDKRGRLNFTASVPFGGK
jgi:hypothetical protein